MPILGQEQPVLFSMDEVFNPTTANMLLQAQQNYGNILRQDYKESLNNFKDFNKEFGNFYSAIEADNQRYYDQTLGGLGNLYDAMVNQGIDPLRSVEGRAMLQKYIATRPYGELANIRRSAESAKEYIKNRDALIAQGLYNPKFDEFIYGEVDPTFWDTSERGIWNRTSPEQYKDLNQSTKHWFDNMELSYDEAASKATGGIYDIYSKSEGTMRAILDTNLKDYLSTNIGKFHLAEYGGDVEALKNAIIDANKEVKQEKRSMNDLYKMQMQFAHDIEMENLQHQHALARQQAKGIERDEDLNVFEAAVNNSKAGGKAKYSIKDVDKEGIIPHDLNWYISTQNYKGNTISTFEYTGRGKPTFYVEAEQHGRNKEKYGAIRMRQITPSVDLAKFKSVENLGEIKAVKKSDGSVSYYNKVFVDGLGTGVYWLRVDGSRNKPGKTGVHSKKHE